MTFVAVACPTLDALLQYSTFESKGKEARATVD